MSVTTASRNEPLRVRQVAGFTGAEILGLSASSSITESIAEQIRNALTEHAVVFIRDQGLAPDRHLEIAYALGTPKNATKYLDTLATEGHPEIGVINDQGKGTARWHTDLAWSEAPVQYSILHMQQSPSLGGDTCWANQYAAFEHLSAPIQSLLLSLTAQNVAGGRTGANTDSYVHPLVISNPGTRRRALFFSPAYTTKINELTELESDHLLAMLSQHSTRPEFVCRWNYQSGDIAIWDNHYVLHYAVNDYCEVGRKIHRIEIEGFAPKLLPAI